jgi:tetratricopeptide (TPR) repeat protein
VTTPPKTMLTEAIAAASSGDRARARELLSRLLRADSSNAEYWVWMSAVVESKRERIYCLESALKLDPTSRAAMRGLVILGARTPKDAEVSAALRIPRRQVEVTTSGVTEKRSFKVSWSRLGAIVLGLAGIAVIGAVAVVIVPWLRSLIGSGLYRPASTLPPINLTPSTTILPGTPTSTPIPAATRVVRTPIPTELALTPLALLLDFNPTPTPLYGATPHAFEDYELGLNALIRGDYELALSYMENVIDYDSTFPDAHYFIGEAQRFLGNIADAIRAYDQGRNLNPDYAPVYLGRGRALLSRNSDAAVNDFDSAISIDPTITEAYLELGTFYASNSLWLRLETTMEDALEAGVTTPMIYVRLSQAKLNLDKYEEALMYALEGSANDPTLLPGYLAVGRSYVALSIHALNPGYFAAALWPLETYVVYSPEDHRGWADLGRALLGSGWYDDSMIALNRALELQDRYAPAYLARGILNTELGDYEAALDDLYQARRYASESYDLLMAFGRALYLAGDYTEALKMVNPAIERAHEEKEFSIEEVKLGESWALRALISETNPDLIDYAILNWEYTLSLENLRPETRILAQNHLYELTGEGPTRTPTASLTPTPTITATSTETPVATSTAILTLTSTISPTELTSTPSPTPTP